MKKDVNQIRLLKKQLSSMLDGIEPMLYHYYCEYNDNIYSSFAVVGDASVMELDVRSLEKANAWIITKNFDVECTGAYNHGNIIYVNNFANPANKVASMMSDDGFDDFDDSDDEFGDVEELITKLSKWEVLSYIVDYCDRPDTAMMRRSSDAEIIKCLSVFINRLEGILDGTAERAGDMPPQE